jgi:hypothetical protein
MKNDVFWDLMPCAIKRLTLILACVISSALKMEATSSSETLVYNKTIWRHIPEGGILHSSL